MSSREANAVLAIFGGLVLAVAMFVPFVVLSYRRRGTMTVGRTVTWVAGLIYFLAIWTYTLLPLPDPAVIACQGHNLVPGEFLDRIRAGDTSSLTALIHNSGVQEFAFNIALFVPLGFVTRLLWRRGVVFTTLAGTALSAFVELTQATGVWGIYHCAYRYGEIDDVISNGAGALLGGLLSYPVARLVTFDDPVDPADLPTTVTPGRRLVGMVCDALSLTLATMALRAALVAAAVLGLDVPDRIAQSERLVPLAAWLAPAGLGLLVTLATGRTVGDWAVQLRFTRPNGRSPLPLRLVRYLAGVGGWAALTAWYAPAGTLFAALSGVTALVTRSHGGLAGLLSRQQPKLTTLVARDRPGDEGHDPAGQAQVT